MSIRAAVLTISDKGARGDRPDTSGAIIVELLGSIGASINQTAIIPDERSQIEAQLRTWATSGELDLIVTTGGTGLSPRDVTPEATAAVIDRPVPGLAEAMRAAGAKYTPLAILSRGVAGACGQCLIVNLPGSPKGVEQNLSAVIDVLPHAVELLRGRVGDHTAAQSKS